MSAFLLVCFSVFLYPAFIFALTPYVYYLYLFSHDTTYLLLAVRDLHRTSLERRLEAPRKAAEVLGIDSLYPGL